MIVDCHTHVWDDKGRFAQTIMPHVQEFAPVDLARHLQAIDPVDHAIVLAFKSRHLNAEIPNRYVAEYVSRHSKKLIGFAGIDPTEHDALEELRIARDELLLKGVVVSPAMQNFHPSDTRAMSVYEECARTGMPVVFDQNQFNPAARMDFGKPYLLDEVAREFPTLKVVVAHLGHPWIQETIVLLAKHANVYADVSGLLKHPWQAYTALLSCYEFGVINKLLFGSNYPFRSPAACIEALYSVNQVSAGTNLQTIPREQLRGIVERDALKLLGIGPQGRPTPKSRLSVFEDDE